MRMSSHTLTLTHTYMDCVDNLTSNYAVGLYKLNSWFIWILWLLILVKYAMMSLLVVPKHRWKIKRNNEAGNRRDNFLNGCRPQCLRESFFPKEKRHVGIINPFINATNVFLWAPVSLSFDVWQINQILEMMPCRQSFIWLASFSGLVAPEGIDPFKQILSYRFLFFCVIFFFLYFDKALWGGELFCVYFCRVKDQYLEETARLLQASAWYSRGCVTLLLHQR